MNSDDLQQERFGTGIFTKMPQFAAETPRWTFLRWAIDPGPKDIFHYGLMQRANLSTAVHSKTDRLHISSITRDLAAKTGTRHK
jgi:hypothetical protein